MRRRQIGQTQQWLGAKLGLTFQQVQKYEKGANRVGASRMVQIAQLLEVPVAWFYEGVAVFKPPQPGSPSTAALEDFWHLPHAFELATAFAAMDDRQRGLMAKVAAEIAATVPAGRKEAA